MSASGKRFVEIGLLIPPQYLYVFLDEGGNFDFSQSGTRYLTFSAISVTRSFGWEASLSSLKYDLLEHGFDLEYFHAAEDRQIVRDRVFEVICRHLPQIRIDSIVVEKRKTGPALRPIEKIYPKMLGYLLRYIVQFKEGKKCDGVFVLTDRIPHKKKRLIIEKSVKQTLSEMLPPETSYRILHYESKSYFSLQVADYCNWAIYRKWASDGADKRSYKFIRQAVRSEFEIFRTGEKFYY